MGENRLSSKISNLFPNFLWVCSGTSLYLIPFLDLLGFSVFIQSDPFPGFPQSDSSPLLVCYHFSSDCSCLKVEGRPTSPCHLSFYCACLSRRISPLLVLSPPSSLWELTGCSPGRLIPACYGKFFWQGNADSPLESLEWLIPCAPFVNN